MADYPDLQTTEEGREYEKQIDMFLSGEKRDFPSYYGGMKVASGTEFVITSPIDESITYGRFQEPEEGIMVEAVTAAKTAFESWSKVPVAERAAYFEKYLNLLKARRLYYAAMVTVSAGMVRQDALSEVDSLITALEGILADAASYKGKPFGVWAVISAHNSPMASPIAYAVAAMVAGNSVVMNPSKYCPTPVYSFYEAMEKYSLPGGVLNLVVDRKDESTEELANDMRVAGIAASGSGDRLEDLMFLQVDDELRFINDIKGMNPAIVYRPSDMKAAARDIVESAFAFSGQRLYSCSKVIVTAEDQKRLIENISEIMKDLEVGDPVNDTAFTGPIISKDAVKRFKDLAMENMPFTISKAPGAVDAPSELYVSPIVVSGLDEENELGYMDSGLPILNIKVVESLDRAFEELEDTECGLSAGIFAKDPKVIARFKEQVDVPHTYVNQSSRSLGAANGAVLANFCR